MKREDWREDAVCVGKASEVFFPHHTLAENKYEGAKEICQPCPVKRQCLNLVINLDERDDRWGVFGGKTPAERRDERAKRKRKTK